MIDEVKTVAKSRSEKKTWNVIDALAKRDDVYVARLNDFAPIVAGEDIYMFVHEGQALLLLIDKQMAAMTDELADEESFADNNPLYFTESSHRVSPVYKLRVCIHMLRQSCRICKLPEPDVMGLVISNVSIINYDDMGEAWDAVNVFMLDCVKDINHRIATNNDTHLPGQELLNNYVVQRDRGLLTTELDENDPTYVHHDSASVMEIWDEDDFELDDDDDEDDDDDNPAECDEKEEEEYEDVAAFNPVTGEEMNLKQLAEKPNVQILEPVNNPTEALDQLVGMEDIRTHLNDLIAMHKYNKMLRRSDPKAKTHAINLHAIFSGPVGTGKTTVGRIYGALLREAGMLSKGKVILANRGSFVGTKWGEEEKNVRRILNIAKGNVLFIDEAYLLVTAHKEDPGRLVLPMMLEILANEEYRDIAIILAGYDKPMKALLETNQGLESRFVNRFTFRALTYKELLEVTRIKMAKFHYRFTATAYKRYSEYLLAMYNSRDEKTWGNGREVANLLERIYIRHANRCVKDGSHAKLWTITAADIPEYTPVQKNIKIGFR